MSLAEHKSYALLSEPEREALRLLARGHDAKSAAAALGVSVHAINERLRDARRKLGATSSREGARLVAEIEDEHGQKTRDKDLGVGGRRPSMAESGRAFRYARIALIGSIAMSIIILSAIFLLPAAPAQAPRVVATSPGAESTIAPGPFILSVTFDQPMRERSYSFVQISPETYPDCDNKPVLSGDRRTFSMRCSAKPGQRYDIWLNRPPYRNFRSASGLEARPFRLAFAAR